MVTSVKGELGFHSGVSILEGERFRFERRIRELGWRLIEKSLERDS